MHNLIGNNLVPTKFQQRVINKIMDKDSVLLVMPTNSGKTLVAYNYADLIGESKDRIIFTAPIKALSVERYQELKSQGFAVDMITGDVRVDTRAPIICMTQEIYNNEFTRLKSTVIIDEFHYIFRNQDRARSYIEAIEKTNPESQLMLMSATIDDPNSLAEWLGELSNRKFSVAESNQRLVPLEYDYKGISSKYIKDSIVFCFSRKDIMRVLDRLKYCRKKIHPNKAKEIDELARTYSIEFFPEWEYGLSRYHGKLLPKEKMIIEYLFRHGYIDTVVGTDSLALGVNLPAQYTILSQLRKPTGDPIEISEFMQLCGRAGRFGQFSKGIATFMKDSPVNRYDKLPAAFKSYSKSKLEPTSIDVDIDYSALLNGRYLEEEIDNLVKYHYPKTDSSKIYSIMSIQVNKANEDIKNINSQYKSMLNEKEYETFEYLLSKYYLPEWNITKNAYYSYIMAISISKTGIIHANNIIDSIVLENKTPGVLIYELLLANKWFKSLKQDPSLRVKNTDKLYNIINGLDETIFNPDLRIDRK